MVSVSYKGPSRARDYFSSSILARKAKNKVKTQLRFWLPSGPALARSTAPTFHDFRTFPKLRQLQGRNENEEKKKKKTGRSKLQTQNPSSLGQLQGWQGLPGGSPPL